MSNPISANKPIPAYLVPTPVGARFAISAAEPDPRRRVLNALLRGGSSRPMPLAMLAEVSGVNDRKALGAILFNLQRDGWISGEVEPLTVAHEPLGEAVPPLLETLSSTGHGVLADDKGLCYAFAGYARADAERLAAFSSNTYPLLRQYREFPGLVATDQPPAWALLDEATGVQLTILPLFVGGHLFHLSLAGTPREDSPALIKLAALLLRRYVGTC